MRLVCLALAVCICVIISLCAAALGPREAEPDALRRRYMDGRKSILELESTGRVDVESLQEMDRIGRSFEEAGDIASALECFEVIAVHGGSHAAMRFLAAEMGLSMALQERARDPERALRLLEAQISLAPKLLELTPPGVNPDGSPLDVLAACPDAARAELLVKAEEYEAAIPLIEKMIDQFETELGVLKKITLEDAGMEKVNLYNWLVLCYGGLIRGEPGGKERADLREGLYEATMGALRETPEGAGCSASLVDYLPLAFDSAGPAHSEILKMTEMVKAAGKMTEFVLALVVLPDAEARPGRSSGEEMEAAYQDYLALIEELQDAGRKTELKAYFLLRRLGNAIRKLGDRDLADALVAEVEAMAPLPDWLPEMFVELQEAYLERFTDVKLQSLPFGELAQAATRGLPKKSDGSSEKSAGTSGRGSDRGFGLAAWHYLLPAGLLVVCAGLALRRRR